MEHHLPAAPVWTVPRSSTSAARTRTIRKNAKTPRKWSFEWPQPLSRTVGKWVWVRREAEVQRRRLLGAGKRSLDEGTGTAVARKTTGVAPWRRLKVRWSGREDCVEVKETVSATVSGRVPSVLVQFPRVPLSPEIQYNILMNPAVTGSNNLC